MLKFNNKVCAAFFALIFALVSCNFTSALSTLHHIRPLKTGDVIYFDNSETNWNEVRIYFYSGCGGTELVPWGSRLYMEQSDDNIYKFEITDDLNIEDYMDDHLVFSDSSGHQTISLGFIETGYAYLPNADRNGRKYGYWYVYDKTELIELIKKAEEYAGRTDYFTAESYENLISKIRSAQDVLSDEIIVEKTADAPNDFYTRFDVALEELNEAIDELVEIEHTEDEPVPVENPTTTDNFYIPAAVFSSCTAFILAFVLAYKKHLR